MNRDCETVQINAAALTRGMAIRAGIITNIYREGVSTYATVNGKTFHYINTEPVWVNVYL